MCSMCSTVEGTREAGIGVYPYRCHRCGRCFLCGHWLIGYKLWVCLRPIGWGLSIPCGWVPTTFSTGVPTLARSPRG